MESRNLLHISTLAAKTPLCSRSDGEHISASPGETGKKAMHNVGTSPCRGEDALKLKPALHTFLHEKIQFISSFVLCKWTTRHCYILLPLYTSEYVADLTY